MEIKFKLFTVIAQALDKLKKQFDKTDKSLVKTQTTLDETIVNIDNVVDSVARTMTEALDPYFVDMIYGYIDDNGKFKLGVIKDPWKDINIYNANISDIIPDNTTQLYHWGDIDIFSSIITIGYLLRNKNLMINLDISKLFPNLQQFNFRALYNTSINELIIPIDIKLTENVINKCIINELIFDYRNNTFDEKKFSYNAIRNNTINSLKIINTPLNSVVAFPKFDNNDFKFDTTNAITGWEYITKLCFHTFGFNNNKIDEIYVHNGITMIDILFVTGPYVDYSKISILSFKGANKHITYETLSDASYVKDFKIDNFENLSTYILAVEGLLLSQRYINYENLYIGNKLIIDTLEIPETVTSINNYIFSGNTHIKNLILHDKLTYIGILALPPMVEKIYLTSLTNYLSLMLDNDSIIGGNADINRQLYLNNELIENLVIPDDITELKYAAFRSCVFETVDLNNVINIYRAAFYQTNIGYINGENVENIGQVVFNYCNCNVINLPNVINLEKWAFQYAIVKDIKIPKLKTLEYGCFRGCESDKIIIPEGVTLLPAYCFALSKIGYIVLPSTLTDITTEAVNDQIFGDNAIVYIKSVTPPNITHILNSSTHHSSYTIYVPTNSVEAYKSHAKYVNIKNRIFPYDFELNPDNIQLDYE